MSLVLITTAILTWAKMVACKGKGAVNNNVTFSLGGTVSGAGVFTNDGILTVSSFAANMQKTGGLTNNGTINFSSSGLPTLNLENPDSTSNTLANNGIINMSNSKIDNGTLINNINGQINGNGTITSTLTNNGSINVGSGTLSIAQDFVNSKTGYINLS